MNYMFPQHKCGLMIQHNEHKSFYMTAKEQIDQWGENGPAWESEELKQKSVETDEVWMMQWYPQTPVGFYQIAAPTIEDLLRFAKSYETASNLLNNG